MLGYMVRYKAGKEKEEKEKSMSAEVKTVADPTGSSKKEELEENDQVSEDEVEKLIEWSQQASFDQ